FLVIEQRRDDLFDGAAFDLGGRRQDDAVAQHAGGEALDVVGDYVVAPVERRGGAGGAGEQGRGARARPAFEVGAFARRADEADDIVDDLVGEAHRRDRVDRFADRRRIGDPLDAEIGDRGA